MKQQWGTRAGFILAAMGSAIGLGNIWRFPAVAYENGGGAFFLPYLFALLTAGIPLLILEFTIGHKYKGSAPLSYARMNKKAEWIGWWQVMVSFVISTYYPIIIAWAASYAIFSFNLSWGTENTTSYFVGDYLEAVGAGTFGGLNLKVLIPLIFVWAITLGVLFKGVKRGIEVANRIFIPTLVVLFLIIVLRAITLDGAMDGLNAFFKPNWEMIMNGKVWVAAYGQIFFSLSIAFAIMITYSSYLPKKAELTNSAFMTGFGNSSFELLAGIGVFGALGFMAAQQGVPVDEVVKGGVLLAFAVFPEIINQFPAFNWLFGFLFFTSLILAGLSSLISISETYIAAVQDKFNVSRKKAVTYGGGLAALISLLFATRGGINFLDVADHFINSYGVALSGLIEVVAITWLIKNIKSLQTHANELSDIRLGAWWTICLSIITPIVLGYMMIQNIISDITTPYGGGDYPIWFLNAYGWTVAALALIIGILLSLKPWDNQKLESNVEDKKEASN